MKLSRGQVSAVFSDENGALCALRDEKRGLDYISKAGDTPFRVTWENEGAAESRFLSFSIAQGETSLTLCWTLPGGAALHACVTVLPDGLSFSSFVESTGNEKPLLIEYPVIGGMNSLGPGSFLAHAYATGLLIHEPLQTLSDGGGVRYAPYPEGFSGASMQFFSYGCVGKGALLFMAEDREHHTKWLNCYRRGDAMEATLMYGYEDLDASPAAPYPFSVRFLSGQGWQEAAAKYKAWAIHSPWCAQGPLALRPHCEWLMQKVGLCTFGVNAGHDRARYIRRYHRDMGTAVFHVLGPDWTHTPQTFWGENPGGLPDWVPTRFHPETLRAIDEVGDYFAPFEFDYMALPNKGDAAQVQQAYQRFPAPNTFSRDGYRFHMVCPCEPYTAHLHRDRDVQIVQESGADAMYYDISANNLLHLCLSEHHHHKKGGGPEITAGYQARYTETKNACAKEKGEYFPVGTEMMNEVFLPQLDFYQARAGARPCSALEMWPWTEAFKQGKAELIPLFAYVYHEYGAVRMDGWGKLVEEVGDLFYDSAAKIYLWGGLYELNYEYSPAEALDGVETSPEEHYYRFHPRGFEYSAGRARYLRQFAALRTGAGNRYLAYGQMMDEPKLDVPVRTCSYFHYNHNDADVCKGFIDVPAVRISAYRSCDEKETGYALFLINTDVQPCTVSLSLQPEDYPGACTVSLLSGFDADTVPAREEIGTLPLHTELTLPARKVIMIEILKGV